MVERTGQSDFKKKKMESLFVFPEEHVNTNSYVGEGQ